MDWLDDSHDAVELTLGGRQRSSSVNVWNSIQFAPVEQRREISSAESPSTISRRHPVAGRGKM